MRYFTALWGALILVGFLMAASKPVGAQEFVAGRHYFELPRPLKVNPEDKRIEVVMFFWYGCGGCYHLDKSLLEWEKTLPKDVYLIRLPALFNQLWARHGQIFLALQALGVDHSVHQAVFESIQRQRKPLLDDKELNGFLAEQGLDVQEFRRVYDSPEIKAQMDRIMKLMAAYGFDSVPVMIVNGKYRFDFSSSGGLAVILRVADYLIQHERVSKTLGGGAARN